MPSKIRPPKIRHISDLPKTIRMLVYGPPGAGKTYFAGTADDLLVVDVEQGTTTLAAAGVDADVWTVTEFDEIWDVHDYLRNEEHPYKTVALDSFSDLVGKGIDSVLAEAELRDGKRLPDSPTLQDYGRVTVKCKRVLRHFRDLPVDLILICLVREGEGDRLVMPDLPQAVRNLTNAYMDIVAYMEAVRGEEDEIVHKMLFQSPSSAFWTKDRFGSLGVGTRNPRFPDIRRAAFGKDA